MTDSIKFFFFIPAIKCHLTFKNPVLKNNNNPDPLEISNYYKDPSKEYTNIETLSVVS